MKTLHDKIRMVAICDDDLSNLTADHLTDYQKDYLTAEVMRDMQELAYELITNAPNFDDAIGKVIIALEENNLAKRKEIFQDIGELLLKGAFEGAKKIIDQEINFTAAELSFNRQLNC